MASTHTRFCSFSLGKATKSLPAALSSGVEGLKEVAEAFQHPREVTAHGCGMLVLLLRVPIAVPTVSDLHWDTEEAGETKQPAQMCWHGDEANNAASAKTAGEKKIHIKEQRVLLNHQTPGSLVNTRVVNSWGAWGNFS